MRASDVIPALLGGLTVPAAVRAEIATLIARKREVTERETMVHVPVLEDWLRAELTTLVEITDTRPPEDFGRQADDLFRWVITETQNSVHLNDRGSETSCC